ncbi:hypothetical protein [Mucilaginibacter sp.]|uniref:hypothetical protein n=1 Tax=Mucilaginibacter sp. TaxID=1882438 RepID=UPI00374D7A3C
MIARFFFILFPLISIIAAPVMQIVLFILKAKGKVNLPFYAITFIAFVVGCILPVVATMIIINRLPPGTKCLTSEMSFCIVGVFFTIVSVPLIGIVNYIIIAVKSRQQKSAGV